LKEIVEISPKIISKRTRKAMRKVVMVHQKLKQEQPDVNDRNSAGSQARFLLTLEAANGDRKKKGGCYICEGPHQNERIVPMLRGLRETGRQLNVILVEGIIKLHSVTRRKVVITRQVRVKTQHDES
jgi:hypothetical protein